MTTKYEFTLFQNTHRTFFDQNQEQVIVWKPLGDYETLEAAKDAVKNVVWGSSRQTPKPDWMQDDSLPEFTHHTQDGEYYILQYVVIEE